MFDFIDKAVNVVKRPNFNRCMEYVDSNIKRAWELIKLAEDYAEGNFGEEYAEGNTEEYTSGYIRAAKENLKAAFKYLTLATSNLNMPKNDSNASRRVVEVIVKLCDRHMHDCLFPGWPFGYEFKNKSIQKEWEIEVSSFFKYAKELIPYEESIMKHPNSSRLKDYNKNSGQG